MSSECELQNKIFHHETKNDFEFMTKLFLINFPATLHGAKNKSEREQLSLPKHVTKSTRELRMKEIKVLRSVAS